MTNATPPEDPTNPSASPEVFPVPKKKSKNEKRRGRRGTWALVLGIIGIVFAFTPMFGFGIFLGSVALILGGIGLLRKRRRALTGTVLGALALIVGIMFSNVYSGGSSSSSVPAASSTGDTSSAASEAPVSTPSAPVAKASAASGTADELQALTAAKGYLISAMGFSQASLIAQLTSTSGNGFAQPDAQWAVDHSGADWNAQALTAAKGYLTSGMGFSQASLTAQLTSTSGNQFVQAEAEYGVANSGADWNAQAVKAAKGYLASGMGFSRQSLISQLSSASGNQFTQTQAAYAATQVGLK